MRIWFFSDLHIERDGLAGPSPFDVPAADVCVVPGDVSSSMWGSLSWLERVVRPRMPVVFVPGNHEFYDAPFKDGARIAGRIAESLGIDLLDDGSVTVGSVRFVGATLWADYALEASLSGIPVNRAVTEGMDRCRGKSDFARIRWSCDAQDSDAFRNVAPEDLVKRHWRSRQAISELMSVPHDGPTVVVSHHAPLPACAAPEFLHGDHHSMSYVSDLSREMGSGRPAMWLHGHVHTKHDFRHGGTRVVCNPRGYSHEDIGFTPDLVLEL